MEKMNAAQGKKMDISGYYHPDAELAAAALRPSETFNALLTRLS